MMTTRIIVAAFVLAGLLIAPAAVRAHAFLDHSDPAVGSTVPTVADGKYIYGSHKSSSRLLVR